jgi:NAD(P)-dependent dehydrogenase (short-subunit alcohol dehydrogenase family)
MQMRDFRLDEHVAVVTGAGRGIGAGIAMAYAQAGADVVLEVGSQLVIQPGWRLAVGGSVGPGVAAAYSSSIAGYCGGALPWVATSRG